MEDLTRTSFPGIGCFFYRGSKSNGAGGERCFHEVSGVSSEPHEWARDLRTAIRSCRTSTMKHSPGTVLPSHLGQPRVEFRQATSYLAVALCFRGFSSLFKRRILRFFATESPPNHCSDALNRRTRCFSGDPLDPLNRYEPIMGRENFVISRLLWKYSHSKLSS